MNAALKWLVPVNHVLWFYWYHMSTRFTIRPGSGSTACPVCSSAAMLACVCLLWAGVGPVRGQTLAQPTAPGTLPTPTAPTTRGTPAAERRILQTRQKLDRQFMNTPILTVGKLAPKHRLQYRGLLVDLARTKHPLQMINPFRPESVAEGNPNSLLGLKTGRAQGIELFSLRF